MDILMCCGQGETTLNSIYHSYTNIQTVMDILMCCGQGGDNSKFHISHIHKHSDSYGYINVSVDKGETTLNYIYHSYTNDSDSHGYIEVMCGQGETTLNSIYHSYTNIQTVMDILMCCVQGGDNSKFIYHSYTNIQTVMDILMLLCTRGRQL